MKRFNLLNSLPLVVIICFLLALILGVGFLWPKLQDLREVQKNIKEKEGQLQSNKEYFSNLKEIKISLKEYQGGLSKISSALPNDPSLPSLFNFLQKASSQSGLVLKRISPFTISSSEEFPALGEIQFGLEVVGSYPSFKNFLSTLEESARLIEVENISFLSPEENKPFTFSLRIKVYSY